MRVLRKYQRRALKHCLLTEHPALFMDMRLGKSLVAMRTIKLLKPRDKQLGLRVLVVAPNSALPGWERECKLENFNCVWLTGSRKKRATALLGAHSKGGVPSRVVCLINKEGWQALPEIAEAEWDALVADESTFLKNPSTKVTKFFLKNFRDVTKRIILTGTPCPESEADYFCQIAFLRNMMFTYDNYWIFRQRMMRPSYGGFGWEMKPGASDEIRRHIGKTCFVLRRKDAGLKEKRIYETRTLELPPKMVKAYQEMEENFYTEIDGINVDTMWVGGQWQTLRQMMGGFVDKKLVWNGKLNELTDLLTNELKHDHVVVWCCYNPEVDFITKHLNKKKIKCKSMQGKTKLPKRKKLVEDFQSKKFRVFVVQQAVAQMGVDLSISDTAIYYSSPVSQLARKQTEDRILTVDKAARSSPLLFIDLVVQDTVDVDVQLLLKEKIKRSNKSLYTAIKRAMKERIKWTEQI